MSTPHIPNIPNAAERNDNARIDSADTQFDTAARKAHSDALAHVSAGVQAQLHQRRRIARSARGSAPDRRAWPMLAFGSTAALALLVGLQTLRDPDTQMTSQPDTASTHSQATTTSMTATTTPPISKAPASADINTTHSGAIASNDRQIDSHNDMQTHSNLMANHPNNDSTSAPTPHERTGPMLAVREDDDPLLNDLEENPDLYLWLGSENGINDTSESL